MKSITLRLPSLCAILILSVTNNLVADELLIVDLTVFNKVTITATDGVSAATLSGSDVEGVYLEDMFATTDFADLGDVGSGDLSSFLNPSDGSPNLFRGDFSTDPGLNIFSLTDDPLVDFVAGTQAFAGSATWSINAEAYSQLLAGSTAGDIFFPADSLGDISGATAIGTYSVITAVPEPSAMLVLGLLMGVAGTTRRRRYPSSR